VCRFVSFSKTDRYLITYNDAEYREDQPFTHQAIILWDLQRSVSEARLVPVGGSS
jgi:hypothetical protein